MNLPLYTIGHSNLSYDQFKALLLKNGVEVLIDVRSSPYSRFITWANRQPLAAQLMADGFDYFYGGQVLGGRAVYGLDHFLFVDKLNTLVKKSQEQTCVMMCAEKDPKSCHRAFKLSHALHSLAPDLKIKHIVDSGSPMDSRDFQAAQKPKWAFGS